MENSAPQASNSNIETERKYKVRFDKDQFHLKFKKEVLYQTYLKTDKPQTEERLRKIVAGDKIHFVHTLKSPISDTKRFEDEKEITEEMYEQLLKRMQENTLTIHKTRLTFEYKNHCFELDQYHQPAFDFCILEIEGEEEHEAISFPPFIEILEDVTGQKAYANFSLAQLKN